MIIETSTVKLNCDTMQQVIDGKFEKLLSYDSGVMYTLQKNIPAVKLLYKKLTEWKDAKGEDTEAIVEKKEADGVSEEYQVILHTFLEKASKDVKQESDVELLIFYHPRIKLDENGNLKEMSSEEKQYLHAFSVACEENDITFVDMTQDFIDLYETEHIFPNGFPNTAVGVGHLNKYGHDVIAHKLAEVLMKGEKLDGIK